MVNEGIFLGSETVGDTIADIMQTPNRRTVGEYLAFIESPNREACQKLLEEHYDKIKTAKGSKIKHQAWEGGYIDHLREIFLFAENLYGMFSHMGRRLPFTLGDAILTLFLHDLEKPFKYAGSREEQEELASYNDYKDFIRAKAREYGIVLTPEQDNALEYVHGEGDDFNPHTRVQLPLAAFIHICDTASARIFPEYPLEGDRFSSEK